MEHDYKKVFGRKIRILREIHDVTQNDLAKHLGYSSTGAITQVEAGDKGVKFENIQRIAEFFSVDPIYLLDPSEMSKEDLKAAVQFRKMLKKGNKAKYKKAIIALLQSEADQD